MGNKKTSQYNPWAPVKQHYHEYPPFEEYLVEPFRFPDSNTATSTVVLNDSASSLNTQVDTGGFDPRGGFGGLDPKDGFVDKLGVDAQVDVLPRVDGGIDAWGVVVGASFALFVQFGLGNSYGTFQQYYSMNQLQGYSTESISWIGSIQLFLIFFLGTFCGRTFDAYGPRWLLIIGSFLLVLSLFLVSVFTKYHQLMICHGILLGIGSALIYNPCVAVIGQWFVKRRAAAAGIVVAGAGIGGVVFPIMFANLFKRIGFGWTVRAVAFISIALLAISIATIKARLPPRQPPAWTAPLVALTTDRSYAWLIAASFFGFWGLWIPFFFIGDFATYRGMSTELAFYMLPIMNAGSTLGRMVGFIADKWGRFNVLTVSGIFTAFVALGAWTSASSQVSIFVFAVLYGIGSGAFLSLFPPCSAQIAPPELIGSRLGFLWFVMSFGTLTGAPIAGALLRRGIPENQFFAAALFSGATILVGGICVMFARLSISQEPRKAV